MYKISIIVPIYKSEKYLPACIDSIAAQTVFEKIQLILVDDGSPDNCGVICDEFAVKHNNVLVIHKENGGVSSARNAGLDAAQGEYIGFVDSDDTVAPDYYEKLLEAAEKNNCDMAFSSMTLIYNGNKRIIPCWFAQNTVLVNDEIIPCFAQRMLTDAAQNSVWSKIYKNEIINTNNIRFPLGVKIGEDKMFVLAFLRYCNSAVCTGDNGYYYTDIETSAMHSDKIFRDLLSSFDEETELFIQLGINKEKVLTLKSVYIFELLASVLQRSYSSSVPQAKALIKKSFADTELTERIRPALVYMKTNGGRIYKALATSFEKRSVTKALLTLAVQNTITKIGERK